MPNQQLITYIHQNLKLGYTEEQLRKVLISAGYGVRDIDDAIDSVLRPQDLKPLEPAKPKEQQESFSNIK